MNLRLNEEHTKELLETKSVYVYRNGSEYFIEWDKILERYEITRISNRDYVVNPYDDVILSKVI